MPGHRGQPRPGDLLKLNNGYHWGHGGMIMIHSMIIIYISIIYIYILYRYSIYIYIILYIYIIYTYYIHTYYIWINLYIIIYYHDDPLTSFWTFPHVHHFGRFSIARSDPFANLQDPPWPPHHPAWRARCPPPLSLAHNIPWPNWTNTTIYVLLYT